MKTIDMSAGYARYVEPRDVVVQWYMYGEDFNTPFCPVRFR